MLPPASVLTNENRGVNWMLGLLAMSFGLWVCGCSPPGPRALLQGKQLLDEGRFSDAVPKLERAASLLPKYALAWNYLGLAYHGNGQPEPAVNAYRKALSLDNKLMVVRYNLGCLYLEQDNALAAIDELKSYTLLQPAAVEGWLKLGTAQWRARRLEESEKSFRAALDLQAKHPEALNGLGLIHVQRRRWQDALNHFNLAALQDPPFGPALLNSAVIQHQYLNNRSAALQRYRQYLALNPRPADWESVETTARQLDQELHPPPLPSRTTQVAVVAPAITKTNPAPATTNTPSRPAAAIAASSQSAPKTNAPALAAAPKTSGVPSARATNISVALNKPALETSRPPVRPAPAKGAEALTVKPADIEVTEVQSDFVLKPAQELTRAPAPPPPESTGPDRAATPNGSTNGAKRGFFSRLNPFGGKPKTAPADATESATVTRSSDAQPATAPANVPRYTYLSPAAPTPGNKAESEKAFLHGLKAQKAGNRAEAVKEYRAAVKVDPANYDAYHNLGLAALGSGDVRLSLWAYEIALALQPDAEDARYNFALALKAGGYWLDASEQLQKLLATNPGEARVHLSLGNLYSQQLGQPGLAREHYLRMLELNPRHAEAAKIRYWLTTNP